jgi:hypothetical protein
MGLPWPVLAPREGVRIEHPFTLESASSHPIPVGRRASALQPSAPAVLYSMLQRSGKARSSSEAAIRQESSSGGAGRSGPRAGAIMLALRDAGYVEGQWAMQSSLPLLFKLTEKAYQVVAGWPAKPGEDTYRELLAVLEQKIEESDSPDERDRLRKLRDGVYEVGREVLVEVLAKAATGGL